MIVKEHTTANQELMQVAGSKGIQVPNTTSTASQTVAASMSELNGPEFDLAYVLQQHGAHLAAVAMFDHAVNHAMDPDVKAFAAGVPAQDPGAHHADRGDCAGADEVGRPDREHGSACASASAASPSSKLLPISLNLSTIQFLSRAPAHQG